jgi:hypothetical protein
MDPSTRLLANVVAFINQGLAPGATSPPLPPQVLQSVSSAAANILSTMVPNFASLSPIAPDVLEILRAYAAGRFQPNEVVRPQLIASNLLFAEIWKRGS